MKCTLTWLVTYCHEATLEIRLGNRWGVNRLSDFTEKIVRISDLANILHVFAILLIQRIVDLCNILAWIVDLACNLVRILDCDFIVELFADSNLMLDKTIVGSQILLQIWADLYTPIHLPLRQVTIFIRFSLPRQLIHLLYLKFTNYLQHLFVFCI